MRVYLQEEAHHYKTSYPFINERAMSKCRYEDAA
jgi:hypothetical protein